MKTAASMRKVLGHTTHWDIRAMIPPNYSGNKELVLCSLSGGLVFKCLRSMTTHPEIRTRVYPAHHSENKETVELLGGSGDTDAANEHQTTKPGDYG